MRASASTEIWRLSAIEIGRLLARRVVSPVEVVSEVFDRRERLDPILNTLVTLDRDVAMAAAAASEERYRAGTSLGPLDGIPVTTKDNLYAEGLRATWGSRLYADFVAPVDDIAVARLRSAGAIIIGKTNTPEFAISGHTDNPLFGVTRNPWNPDLTPGGSSGGAVAGVAAGLFPLALATDAGGSIRRPASYTGVLGLRPSTGAVARAFGFPPLALDFQAVGPIARSVGDLELMFEAIVGADVRDRASLGAATAMAMNEPARSVERLRIGWVRDLPGVPVDAEIPPALKQVATALGELGHIVDEVTAPFDPEAVNAIFGTLSGAGLSRAVTACDDWRDRIDPALVPMVEQAATIDAASHVRAIDEVNALRVAASGLFDRVDVFLMPVSAAMPWPAEQRFPATIAGETAGPRTAGSFATFVNLLGVPAISVPAPVPSGSLPIGAQLIGKFGDDRRLLRIASELETARPWGDRWPELALAR